uniref:Complete mitochondrial genome n=1 Tax=Podospora anserina (strain S / ATCC MYA-4624 / DSM 980 / FGSC 10383) TaxID=515849 RepID=Q02660_PODAN|nr:unnamed protein product [Podospora anserina]
MTRFELVQSLNQTVLSGSCLPFPAHPLYFMPKVRLELTTKAASMLCSTNWASQAYGEIRNWTWKSDVQSQRFTKLDYIPLCADDFVVRLKYLAQVATSQPWGGGGACAIYSTQNYIISEERLERSRLLTSKT